MQATHCPTRRIRVTARADAWGTRLRARVKTLAHAATHVLAVVAWLVTDEDD